MSNIDMFQEIVKRRLDAVLETERTKGAEYSRNGDRYHNFKTAAALDGETPERALWGMWKKHLVSIRDMIEDLEKHGKVPSRAQLKEKLGDNIVYSLLLEGIVEERRENEDEARAVSLAQMLKRGAGSQGFACRLGDMVDDGAKTLCR